MDLPANQPIFKRGNVCPYRGGECVGPSACSLCRILHTAGLWIAKHENSTVLIERKGTEIHIQQSQTEFWPT